MQYYSTRGNTVRMSSSEAIVRGLAPDGGLFVPADKITAFDIAKLPNNSYQELANTIFKPFLSDYSDQEIEAAVHNAYNPRAFDHPEITPLHRIDKKKHILELWHGPTYAFKDIALQILPHLLKTAMKKTGGDDEIVILTATSGDTGKSALEGFRDIPGIKIIVYFPEKGVSKIQKLQMVTQEGSNVSVAAVKGNFDDTQRGVKDIFNDDILRARLAARGYRLSSANSINWGRLLPQIVYYFWAYLSLINKKYINLGDAVNFTVPTGNFGNILAGYYAKCLGLPVNRLICASNQNNILTDFIKTGLYDSNRKLHLTLSPSMDILISSNLERLLFELTKHNAGKIADWMEGLKSMGYYRVDKPIMDEIQKLFYAGFANDINTVTTIKSVFDDYNYLTDTHTAVGLSVLNNYLSNNNDSCHNIILSTASPYKFASSVARALQKYSESDSELALLNLLASETGTKVPENLADLGTKEIRHKKVVTGDNMRNHLFETLSIN
ncbi:MAG: threonine synthase [Dethiobacteria bacterium]